MQNEVQLPSSRPAKGLHLTAICFTGFAGLLILAGWMFKIFHWPGAGVLLVTSFATNAITVFLWTIYALRKASRS